MVVPAGACASDAGAFEFSVPHAASVNIAAVETANRPVDTRLILHLLAAKKRCPMLHENGQQGPFPVY